MAHSVTLLVSLINVVCKQISFWCLDLVYVQTDIYTCKQISSLPNSYDTYTLTVLVSLM